MPQKCTLMDNAMSQLIKTNGSYPENYLDNYTIKKETYQFKNLYFILFQLEVVLIKYVFK